MIRFWDITGFSSPPRLSWVVRGVEHLYSIMMHARIKCVPNMLQRDYGTLTITMLRVNDLLVDQFLKDHSVLLREVRPTYRSLLTDL